MQYAIAVEGAIGTDDYVKFEYDGFGGTTVTNTDDGANVVSDSTYNATLM